MIRTVGAPEERFSEDALRLMRAVRFSVELDFEIEMNTRRAIVKLVGGLEAIAKERVRDELVKILMTPNAAKGIILLEELDLLRYVLPELRDGIGVGQNKHHIYTVFEHNVRALDYTARENYSLAGAHGGASARRRQAESERRRRREFHVLSARVCWRAHGGKDARPPAILKGVR